MSDNQELQARKLQAVLDFLGIDAQPERNQWQQDGFLYALEARGHSDVCYAGGSRHLAFELCLIRHLPEGVPLSIDRHLYWQIDKLIVDVDWKTEDEFTTIRAAYRQRLRAMRGEMGHQYDQHMALWEKSQA